MLVADVVEALMQQPIDHGPGTFVVVVAVVLLHRDVVLPLLQRVYPCSHCNLVLDSP